MRLTLAAFVVLALCLSGCGSKKPGTGAVAENYGASSNAVQTVRLESGLEYKDIEVGKGPEAKDGDTVIVHYKGWLDDGTVFDSSRKPGASALSFTLGVGAVIPGWDQGLKGMRVGGMRELTIPPDLAYGDQEQPTIPADSTLHFTVELLQIGE